MDAKVLSETEQILQNWSWVNRNLISVLRTLTLNEKNTSRNKAETVLVSIMLLWSTGTMQRALQRAVNRWASLHHVFY